MRRARPSPLAWWLEGLVILGADQAFEWVRSKIVGSASSAVRSARTIVRLEKWTWTYHELTVQKLVLPYTHLVEGLDIYYGTIHFAGPPIVLIALWRWFPDQYRRWRNALVAASLLGLFLFWVYPLAPPRLMPPPFHFADTMRSVGGLGPLDSGRFKDDNPFAAMPSLHLAWSTWCACAVATVATRPWKRIAVFLYPAATLFVVMATGNHWFLDAVGGWVVLALGWAIAGVLERLLTPAKAFPEAGDPWYKGDGGAAPAMTSAAEEVRTHAQRRTPQ